MADQLNKVAYGKIGHGNADYNGLAPRELGITERLSGLVAGLYDINARLEAISEKISGGKSACGANAVGPSDTSLTHNMAEAEGLLRRALSQVESIGDVL